MLARQLSQLIGRWSEIFNSDTLKITIAQAVIDHVIENTDNQVDFRRAPFARLSKQNRSGKILLDTGLLRSSWLVRKSGDSVNIVNNARSRDGHFYAKTLNDGNGRIPPRMMLPGEDSELPDYMALTITQIFNEYIRENFQ